MMKTRTHAKRGLPLFVAALLLLGLTPILASGPRTAHAAPSTTAHFTSVGFAIGWQMPTSPPWSDLTQTDLFALQTTAGSALDAHFLAGVNVPAWVAANHAHGVQALITIGGSADQHWQDACTGSNKAAFIANLVSYMQANGFDGIDLDIEDGLWASQGPPSPDMTACIQAVASAVHALGKFVSADVVTNWEGPWFAPSQASVDQFNLMTYGDTCTPSCASFAADVAATISQGLPAAKFTLGVDVIDGGEPVAGDCGRIAAYAAGQALAGTMVWDIATDEAHSDACLNQIGPYINPAPPPTPTSTVPPTATLPPSPSATPTQTPPPPQSFPCVVLVSGVMTLGTCTGTFTP